MHKKTSRTTMLYKVYFVPQIYKCISYYNFTKKKKLLHVFCGERDAKKMQFIT